MKILLANYRYFISGGPERYLFNLSRELEERGHTVIPFSIRYARNRPTSYADYFVSPLGNENEVYFRDQRQDIKTLWKTTRRLFYDVEVENAVRRIVADTKPDIAYVLHYLRKLSPAILVGLKKEGIPIVVRLSDYAMLCPQAHFIRGQRSCELCLKKNLGYSLRYRCIQNSLLLSAANYCASRYHQHKKYFDLVDKFVVTNEFMFSKMIEAGYSEERLIKIPTFVDVSLSHLENQQKNEELLVYFGRIEEIKGIHVLINALNLLTQMSPNLKFRLMIFGDGDDIYLNRVKQMTKDFHLESRIEFCGKRDLEEIGPYISKALVSIVPSICYENLPNVILESYAYGTAVLASETGSIPFVVKNKENGFLFSPGDPLDLAKKIEYCLLHPSELILIGRNNKMAAEREYGKNNHLHSIESLFGDLIARKKNG